MEYPDIAIKAFTNCIADDQEAYQWLNQSKWKELAALADFLCCSNPEALNYLLRNKNKYATAINFLAALQREEKAFDLLLNSDDKKWAAVVASVHGSDEAYEWLAGNNLDVFVALADMLIRTAKNSGKRAYYSDDNFGYARTW